MTPRTRRIAIVGHPWENVVPQSGSSMVIIAYGLAHHLPPGWRITLYGRRLPGQKRQETDGETIEIKRLSVIHKPHMLFEVILSILACYTKRRVGYHMSYFYHTFYALRVALSIRASKYNVVIVNNFSQFSVIIKLLNPSAIVCLNMQCEWLSQYATAGIERRMRNLDLIMGCSEYITEGTRARFPAIAERCHTVYNGVDTDRFCLSPPQNERPQRLLFLARVSPEKGVHVLIEAFKILVESRPALQLDIVGYAGILPYIYLAPDPGDRAIASLEPFYGNGLSEMVRRQLRLKGQSYLGLKGQSYLGDLVAAAAGDDRIVFHGGRSHNETLDYYRQAAVLVFPSVWHEPFGLPTVEAMACGLPVVSTYSGGIPEIVEHGRTGMLVARGDAQVLAQAISQILDDPALARAMGEAGRQRVLGRFTWEASARRLADLIESVSGVPGTHSNIPKRGPRREPPIIRAVSEQVDSKR